MKYYFIQTRCRDAWHRLHFDSYETLEDATKGLERYIDQLFFDFGEVLPTNIFRIAKKDMETKDELYFSLEQ